MGSLDLYEKFVEYVERFGGIFTKSEINTKLNTKVDKVDGKGLSTNDYDNTEKNKLSQLWDKTLFVTFEVDRTDMLNVHESDKTYGIDGSDNYNDWIHRIHSQILQLHSDDTNKVDKITGKGLSSNDFTDTYKNKIGEIDGKVDKVSGKGLSTNDFTDTYKGRLDDLDLNLSRKVDKVSGKGLSTNDFTDTYKSQLDNLEDLYFYVNTDYIQNIHVTENGVTQTYGIGTTQEDTNTSFNGWIKRIHQQIRQLYTYSSEKIAGKVDKVEGKGLSTNDFTNADKAKLDSIVISDSVFIIDSEWVEDQVNNSNLQNIPSFSSLQQIRWNINSNDHTTIIGIIVTYLSENGESHNMSFSRSGLQKGLTYITDGNNFKKLAYISDDAIYDLGLSSNDYTNADKSKVDEIDNKVDKVSGKGLSTNDFTGEYKSKLDNLDNNLSNKVDKVSGKGLSSNDYTNADKSKVSGIDNKVDKVQGKGLSTNDFTNTYKTQLDNLDTNLNNKVDKITGKGLSTNDFTDSYKNKVDDVDNKVDKVTGKGLSTNDFTNALKSKLENDVLTQHQDITGKEDISNKITLWGNKTSNSYPSADLVKNSLDLLDSDKVDKVTGKGLSTNDFTDNYKNQIDNLEDLTISFGDIINAFEDEDGEHEWRLSNEDLEDYDDTLESFYELFDGASMEEIIEGYINRIYPTPQDIPSLIVLSIRDSAVHFYEVFICVSGAVYWVSKDNTKANASDFDTVTATITFANNTTQTVNLYIEPGSNNNSP